MNRKHHRPYEEKAAVTGSSPVVVKFGRLAQFKNRQSIAAPHKGRSSDTG